MSKLLLLVAGVVSCFALPHLLEHFAFDRLPVIFEQTWHKFARVQRHGDREIREDGASSHCDDDNFRARDEVIYSTAPGDSGIFERVSTSQLALVARDDPRFHAEITFTVIQGGGNLATSGGLATGPYNFHRRHFRAAAGID